MKPLCFPVDVYFSQPIDVGRDFGFNQQKFNLSIFISYIFKPQSTKISDLTIGGDHQQQSELKQPEWDCVPMSFDHTWL